MKDLLINVTQPELLRPSMIQHLQSRMLAQPRMPHFMGIGPLGEGVHAMRVALTPAAARNDFSVTPPERDEAHRGMGLAVLATPHVNYDPGTILLEQACINDVDILRQPIDTSMFFVDAGGWAPFDLSVFNGANPIVLKFSLNSLGPASCDVFLVVQRLSLARCPG